LAAKRVYWDSCVWLGLINEEPDKLPRCQHVIQLARTGEIEIWTSALTLAEVFKVSQPGGSQTIPAESDETFERFLDQDFVVIAQVDVDTGHMARRLLRRHSKLKKPPDAVHLATAVLNDLDEFHTFDGTNLLPLNGEVKRADGVALGISFPPEPPIPPQAELDLVQPSDELEGTGEVLQATNGIDAAGEAGQQDLTLNGVLANGAAAAGESSPAASTPPQSSPAEQTATGAQG
jgi:predicted nucleic acid-binding protein